MTTTHKSGPVQEYQAAQDSTSPTQENVTSLTADKLTTQERTRFIPVLGALLKSERDTTGQPSIGKDRAAELQAEALRIIQAGEDLAPAALELEAHRGHARIAYRLARAAAGLLRHVHGIGWHVWDVRRWIYDDQGNADRAALAVIKAARHQAIDTGDRDLTKDAEKCETATGLAGVLKIAASLHPLAITVRDLDADPYLLNTANGTLDLRTMALSQHDPADHITKITNAAYDPHAAGHHWQTFLATVLPDTEVREYLQRMASLGLAGIVLEHILPILTGTGGNGKGVWYGTYAAALGDYAIIAEPGLFMERSSGGHPTGEMDLLSRRMAFVSETDQNHPLAEATLKRLTGGDKIRARRMRMDFVEFTPSHTVALITNHLPKVSGDDPAIWRRLRVIPFDVVIPREEQDSHLPEKLQLELDAVLAWALEGWEEYRRTGLAEPASVLAATGAYQADSDALGRFIDDKCQTGPAETALTETLFTAWQAWAAEDGAKSMNKKAFGQSLEQRGYTSKRGTGGVRVRQGISFIPAAFDLDGIPTEEPRFPN